MLSKKPLNPPPSSLLLLPPSSFLYLVSLVSTAQSMDSTILKIFGKSCALIITGSLPGNDSSSHAFQCLAASTTSVTDSVFGDAYVISLGFVVVMCLTIPIGFFNLDDNIWVQVGGFVGLAICLLLWLVQFLVLGLEPSRMPALGSGYGSVLSVVVFNFGFIMTIPSWLNEKQPEVDAAKTVWVSLAISIVVFLALGILGAMSMDFPSGQDLLAVIDASTVTGVRSRPCHSTTS